MRAARRGRRGCGRVPPPGQFREQMLMVAQGFQDTDPGDQGQVALLDAFDQYGDPAAFEGTDDIGDDPAPLLRPEPGAVTCG